MRNKHTPSLMLAFIFLVSGLFLACDGTPLPEDLQNSEDSPVGQEALPSKSFTVSATVSGSSGGSSNTSNLESGRSIRGSRFSRNPAASRRFSNSSLASARQSQRSAAQTNGGGQGGNGRDLVDLSGNNLFLAGLTEDLQASIIFQAEGDETILGEITLNGDASELDLSGKELGAGQNLIVEVLVNGNSSRSIIPSAFFDDGGRYGFNIIRRPDGNLIIELFIDALPPFSLSDNGSRVVIDTAVDCDHDGTTEAAARYETPDGLVLWDINLDGAFGTPEDACQLFDSNGDGVIDQADSPVSFAIDPNLDGTQSDGETRLLGNNVPEDFINGIHFEAIPAEAIGNGVSNLLLIADIEPAFDGSPIGSVLDLELELTEGTLAGTEGPFFIRNERPILQRTIDPSDVSIQLRSDGSLRIFESLRVPAMETSGILEARLSYQTSSSDTPRSISVEIPLEANLSPILVGVNFIGTQRHHSSSLKAASKEAKVVEGNRVQITGKNFSNDPTQLSITFGGTPAPVLGINDDGSLIDTEVPAGAQSGPISVIQAGIGAQTSEDFIVQGPPLLIAGSSPENNTNDVARDIRLSFTFNRPLDPASLEDGIELHDMSNDLRVIGTSQLSEDGLSLDFITPDLLAATTDYALFLNANLKSIDGVVFDPNLQNAILPEEEALVPTLVFTTGNNLENDTIPPQISSDDQDTFLVQPLNADQPWEVIIRADEALNPSSLLVSSPPTSSDSVRLERDSDGSFIPLKLFSTDEGQTLRAQLQESPLGQESYTLRLSTEVSDLSDNPLTNEFSKSFTIPFYIERLGSISGPPESEVILFGSTFEIGNINVDFNGTPAEIVEESSAEIVVKVPVGATDGPVNVQVGTQSAQAPRDFTVTSGNFEIRRISSGLGAFGVAINALNVAMVSYQNAGEIAFLDLRQELPIDTNPDTPEIDNLQIGGVPTEAILDKLGELGFTTNYGSREQAGESIFVIDFENYTSQASVRVGKRPTRLAVSQDNRFLFVTNFADDTISIINLENLQVEATVPTGDGPNGLTIGPDNRKVYVCNFNEGTLSIIDLATFTNIGAVAVGLHPARVSLSPEGNELFVTNFSSDSISVIDLHTLAIKQTIEGFKGPSAMAFTPDGSRFFVTNRLSNTLQEVVHDSALNDWILGETRVATADTPAGIAISRDGSFALVTSEGSGDVSILRISDPQPVIENLALPQENTAAPGSTTFSCDQRQRLWILGRGLSEDISDLEVSLNGKPVTVIAEGAGRNQLQIEIPEKASSGPIVVTRNIQGKTKISNEFILLVTPKRPKVISTIPGDGAQNVSATTNIIVELNEPLKRSSIFRDDGSIREFQNFPVLRLMRLNENGSQDVMAGTWELSPSGQRLSYLPADGVSFLKDRSNNIYEIVISSHAKDLFGNPVSGSALSLSDADKTTENNVSTGFRSRFQTRDTLGPHLVKALYRDLDQNGVDEGDELELHFNEELFFQLPSFDLLTPQAISLAGGGGSLGTTLLTVPGSTPKRLLATLGANPSLHFGSTPSTLTMIDNILNAVNDYAGNRPLAKVQVPIEVDPSSDSGDNPRLLIAALIDTDTSNSVNLGDELRLIFSKPVLLDAGLNDPTTLIQLSSGDLGASPSFAAREDGNFQSLSITLGNAPNLAGGELISLIGSGSPPLVASETLSDFLGNSAYANEFSEVPVQLGLPGAAQLDETINPQLLDVQGTTPGMSQGDVILVTFTNPVFIKSFGTVNGTLNIQDIFELGVPGDRFGEGARLIQPAFIQVADGSDHGFLRNIAPNQILIELGRDPILTPRGEFGVVLSGANPLHSGRK